MKNLFYVSKGLNKNQYQLRVKKLDSDNVLLSDSFVTLLSNRKDYALKKAQVYVNKYINIRPNVESSLNQFISQGDLNTCGYADLETKTKEQLALISNGIQPFGQLKGNEIKSLPNDYLTWLCKESVLQPNKIILANLQEAVIAVLIEREIVKNSSDLDQYLNHKKEIKLQSEHVGFLKHRMKLTVIIERHINSWDEKYDKPHHFYTLRYGKDLLVYSGEKDLGNEGDTITLEARIAKWENYKTIKQTVISHPKLKPSPQAA